MVVTIKAELDPSQGSWYTNHDLVKGAVSLNVKNSTEVNRVTVALFGVSFTHLTRVDDVGQKFTDQVEERSVVLSLTSQLFPPPGDQFGASYTLKPDTYTWPFQFDIPLESTGMGKGVTPPSLSDLDEDVGYIRYYIETKIEYLSRLRIGSNVNSTYHRLPIVFLPTDSEDLDKVPTYGIFHTNQSRVVSSSKTVSGLFSRLVTSLAHDMAPTCANIATFTMRMEFLLTPGLKFSWVLEAVPASDGEITISAVKLSLRAITHVRAKNVEKTLENTRVLYDKRQLNLKAGDLTAQLHNPAVIIPNSVPPTFHAPNLQREYVIEIKVTWSHQKTSNLAHKAVLRRKIWVRSGMQALPNYETGDVVRPNRDYPQEKWYFRV